MVLGSIQKNNFYFLDKIVENCQIFETELNNISYIKFKSNIVLQDFVSFRLAQIGSLAKQIDEEFKKKNPQFPWVLINGMRNRIVHDYGSVDFVEIYNTASQDIPSLRKGIEKILRIDKEK